MAGNQVLISVHRNLPVVQKRDGGERCEIGTRISSGMIERASGSEPCRSCPKCDLDDVTPGGLDPSSVRAWGMH